MILVFIHSINIPCEPDLDPDSDELHEQNMRSKLIHQPRPLFGGVGHGPPGGQPPFLAAGLAAAMAAAACAQWRNLTLLAPSREAVDSS